MNTSNKIWTPNKADAMFSLYIRKRDGRCMHPNCTRKNDRDTKAMQNSHFYGRGEWVTRFDPENCDTAHRGCHYFKWEKTKNTEYLDFKKKQLGTKRFNALKKKVDDSKKHGAPVVKHSERIIECMEFLRSVGFVDENYRIKK